MIFMGKAFACLVWLFWIMVVDNTAIGQEDNTTITLEYNPSYSSTFNRVMKRGVVICGTNDEFPGFSQETWSNEYGTKWIGFDVDMCRVVATALFGDATAIEFVVVNGKTRFEFLIDGTIDILSAATTYTFTRNVLKKLEFAPTTYYDGQGFIVRKTLGVSSAKQLEGAKICFSSTGTGAKNIADFFATHGINYIPVPVPPDKEAKQMYIDGGCDMYGTDRSGLASNRLGFKDPNRHMILPEIISKEPLGPVVRYGDQQWSDIVRWSIYVLFIAEEMGINSKNIDTFKNNIDPNIQRFMGEKNGLDHPNLGAKLGLPATWSYDIIKQVGNYKEIFDRNIKNKLGLERGLNKLYSDGGLLYAPPLK